MTGTSTVFTATILHPTVLMYYTYTTQSLLLFFLPPSAIHQKLNAPENQANAACHAPSMNTFIHYVHVCRFHGYRLFPQAQSKHSNIVLC